MKRARSGSDRSHGRQVSPAGQPGARRRHPSSSASRVGGRWRTANRKKTATARQGRDCCSPKNCDGTAQSVCSQGKGKLEVFMVFHDAGMPEFPAVFMKLGSARTATARHACRPPVSTLGTTHIFPCGATFHKA
eukprot:gene10752-biopygen18329